MHQFKGFAGAIQSMPRSKAYLVIFGGTFAISGVLSFLIHRQGEHVNTLENDWTSANREYMKFQRNNPIFGISRGLDPK